MEVVPQRVPRRRTPINLVTGVFLKSVFFLDEKFLKFVVTGIFKDRGDSLCIAFKGKRGGVVCWTYDVFNQIALYFPAVTSAVDYRTRFQAVVPTGEDIRVANVRGSSFVYIYDGQHSLSLTSDDWAHFIANLTLIRRHFNELFREVPVISDYIRAILNSEQEADVERPEVRYVDQLYDETVAYKKAQQGGASQEDGGAEACGSDSTSALAICDTACAEWCDVGTLDKDWILSCFQPCSGD